MAGVLVDSNVLLDLFTDDPVWASWSEARLAAAFDAGQVVINPIVYAEISVAFDRIETLNLALPEQIWREALPWEAVFLAGKCFLDYRRRGGAKRSPLPDFPHRRARRGHGSHAAHPRREPIPHRATRAGSDLALTRLVAGL